MTEKQRGPGTGPFCLREREEARVGCGRRRKGPLAPKSKTARGSRIRAGTKRAPRRLFWRRRASRALPLPRASSEKVGTGRAPESLFLQGKPLARPALLHALSPIRPKAQFLNFARRRQVSPGCAQHRRPTLAGSLGPKLSPELPEEARSQPPS